MFGGGCGTVPRMSNRLFCLIAALLVVSACGDDVTDVSASECASTKKWTGDDDGATIMHPGGDCIACHQREGEGPKFTIAGTVYGAANQATDCFGVQGATVEITGADGKVFTFAANEAGNFYSKESVAMPYTARVLFNGKESKMQAPQSTGACNSCHTQGGSNGAPGRILSP